MLWTEVTMRQVTGSNQLLENKKVSIQVTLGGRSFSVDKIAVANDAEAVEFVIDTPRVTLAPRKAVSLDNAAELLRLAGKPCRLGEQSVCSELQADIVAIMAIDCNALTAIIEKWGSRASFTSPLLDMRHSDEHCITIDATEKVCYIRRFENGLQYVATEEYTTAEDILFFVSKHSNGRADIPIYIKGGAKCVKLLRKYYKQVICE